MPLLMRKGVSMPAQWVKSALPPMLGPLPGWTILPVPYLLLSFNLFSIALTVTTILIAIFLKTKGRNLIWVLRRFKAILRAGKIESRPLGYRRRLNGLVHVNKFDFESWRKE